MLRLLSALLFILNSPVLFAGEQDLYDFLWLDPDKKVYVLQNKEHPQKSSFEVDIHYLNNLTSNFQDTNGAGLSLRYFFKEEWGVELSHLQYTNKNNNAYDSIQIVNEQIPFIRNPLSSTSIFLIYSPFYGKVNTFNQIFYYHWSFGVGSGQYLMESNLDSVLNPNEPNTYDQESYNPLQLKTSITFHLNKRVHLKLDILNTNYQAGSPQNPNSKEYKQVNDILWGVGVSF